VRRRDFINLVGGAAVGWPSNLPAQQPATPVIGLLNYGSSPESNLSAFYAGLNDTGFTVGQNVAVEYRYAGGNYDRLPSLAHELVERKVAVIVAAGSTAAALAAKAATNTIPILFNIGSDPVEIGLIESLPHPGGNLTGVTQDQNLLSGKRLELLHELAPKAALIALMVNPANPYAQSEVKYVKAVATGLALGLLVLNASDPASIETAFAQIQQQRCDALLVGADPYFLRFSLQLVSLAALNKVPTIFGYRDFAVDGGLISYGTNWESGYRQIGIYTGRILKGEKPADLPVQRPVSYDLVVNLKAANALGLAVPTSLLLRADEVIE
jgi:putative tryptophan/tyrosine transport system substrate-binding protein